MLFSDACFGCDTSAADILWSGVAFSTSRPTCSGVHVRWFLVALAACGRVRGRLAAAEHALAPLLRDRWRSPAASRYSPMSIASSLPVAALSNRRVSVPDVVRRRAPASASSHGLRLVRALC